MKKIYPKNYTNFSLFSIKKKNNTLFTTIDNKKDNSQTINRLVSINGITTSNTNIKEYNSNNVNNICNLNNYIVNYCNKQPKKLLKPLNKKFVNRFRKKRNSIDVLHEKQEECINYAKNLYDQFDQRYMPNIKKLYKRSQKNDSFNIRKIRRMSELKEIENKDKIKEKLSSLQLSGSKSKSKEKRKKILFQFEGINFEKLPNGINLKNDLSSFFLDRKFINDIPVTFPLFLSYTNSYNTISERDRVENILNKFIKLKTHIMKDPTNKDQILREFILKNGIYKNSCLTNQKISNFSNYLKLPFKFDPQKTIIDIIKEGLNYNGITSEENQNEFKPINIFDNHHLKYINYHKIRMKKKLIEEQKKNK